MVSLELFGIGFPGEVVKMQERLNKFPCYNKGRLTALSIVAALVTAASWCANIYAGISGDAEHLSLI